MKRLAVGFSVVCLLASRGVLAEETYHKYRISFVIGNQSTADGLRTNADNTSLWRNDFGGLTAIDDPRPDSESRNEATIKDDVRYDLQASYGILRWKWAEVTIDSSIGYFEGDVGDLEVSGEFSQVDPPRTRQCGEITRYHAFYIPVGKITQIPVSVGGTMRFRPRASGGFFRGMTPYFGVGVGKIFADIDETAEFFQLSRNISTSRGFRTRPDPDIEGGTRAGRSHQFGPAEAEAPDSFEYHASAGIEFPVSRGLFFVFSGSWMWADEAVDITIDGRHSFGEQTPPGETDTKYPDTGLPVFVESGGFIDYASGRPRQLPGNCRFKVGPKDGIPDLGAYFIQGGEINYSGFTFGVGVRYQF